MARRVRAEDEESARMRPPAIDRSNSLQESKTNEILWPLKSFKLILGIFLLPFLIGKPSIMSYNGQFRPIGSEIRVKPLPKRQMDPWSIDLVEKKTRRNDVFRPGARRASSPRGLERVSRDWQGQKIKLNSQQLQDFLGKKVGVPILETGVVVDLFGVFGKAWSTSQKHPNQWNKMSNSSGLWQPRFSVV